MKSCILHDMYFNIAPLYDDLLRNVFKNIYRPGKISDSMGIFPIKKLATRPNKADSMGILAKNKLVTRVN